MITFPSRLFPLFLALSFVCCLAPAQSPSPERETPALPEVEIVDLGEGVTMEFVLVRPGSFVQGSDVGDTDEAPSRKVAITKPFYLGKYEVTQAQWRRITGGNPSRFKGDAHPVEGVSWEDCRRFLATLGSATGRSFALPTEAQWEYACRAGTTTEYSFGDDEAGLVAQAWYSGNSGLSTHPVGQKAPNAWGIYDMHGNVYEWCADWYSEGGYRGGESADPVGAPSGWRRVLRGGAWLYVAHNLRSADRAFSPPDYRSDEYGLRCVLLPRSESTAPSGSRSPGLSPADALVAQIEDALAESERLGADFLLAELAALSPDDARLESLGKRSAAVPRPPETLSLPLSDGVAMEFVLIRPGVFTMGSDAGGSPLERPARRVRLSRAFYLAAYEVTQAQWTAVMGHNPSAFQPTDGTSGSLPVENVSWQLAQRFFAALNEQAPGRGFRFPSETEWEYACRAGTSGARHCEAGRLDDYAWHGANAGGRTHPVGAKKPNAWGLYDMYGNVWEWCEDAFARYPGAAPSVVDFGGARVARGGAWNSNEAHVSSTFRHDVSPSLSLHYYGLRCALPASAGLEKRRP